MDSRKPTSAPRATAREQMHCADCGRPLTTREQYVGDACDQCEREYVHDTTSNVDDEYDRAA